MSGGRHADVRPDDCPKCCGLFELLCACHVNGDAQALTLAQMAAAVGLAERAARGHLSHLVLHCRVQEDRRTPVPHATCTPFQPLTGDVDPVLWASSVIAPCHQCAGLLKVYAKESRGTWRGVLTPHEAARRAGVSERTARRHVGRHSRKEDGAADPLGHSLVTAGLIAFEARAEVAGRTKHGNATYTRLPDRFLLWPQREHVLTPLGESMRHDRAEWLLESMPWFDRTHREAVWVVRLVADLLTDGWQEHVLLRRLSESPAAEVKGLWRYAARRLPARGELPSPSAMAVTALPSPGRPAPPPVLPRPFPAAVPAPVMRECAECRNPMSRFTAPDVTLCASCRASVAVA